jgi:hypothetical protein
MSIDFYFFHFVVLPRITNLLYKPQSEENKNEQQEVERTSNSIRLHLRIPIQIEKKE